MNPILFQKNAGLPPELTAKLSAIIRRIRLIQVGRGLLATLAVAIASALAVMAVDAAVAIYSDAVRAAISLGALALTLATGYVALARPLADRITPVRMARIIETRHPELQERISSALELLMLGGAKEAEVGSKQLLGLLVDDARSDVSALSAEREFRGATMRPVAIAAAVFAAVLAILFAIRPRETALLLTRAVAPGVPLNNLGARAFTVRPGDLAVVEGETVRFELIAPGEDGSRAELCVERPGEPLAVERMAKRFDLDGGDPVFELEMPAVRGSFRYRMRIGKALTRTCSLTVVPPPAHGEIVCSLSPPPYTGLAATQLVGSVEMPLRAPVGTRADVATRLNRPMRALLLLGDRRSVSPDTPQPSAEAVFSWTFSTNAATRWAIALRDDRAFTNALPWAAYEAIPDYPPGVRLTYPAGGSYTLPPYGHLKTVFELRDDYGLSAVNLVMQPDNEKAPWVVDVEFTRLSKGLWQVARDISLGEFLIGGARKVRIWLEVSDNLPPYLGGPNVTRSRVIAVNLDNAERRSLADQVRIPERDSITNLLEQAAIRLEDAARKLEAAANAPGDAPALSAAMEAAEEAAREAAEKAAEAGKTAEDGLFAGVADDLDALAAQSVEEARGAVEELPLTDGQAREQAVRKAVESMNKAAEEARALVPDVLEKDALLEQASALDALAAQETAQAKKAQERQLTNDELGDWQATQMDLANKFGSLEEQEAAPADAQRSLIQEGRPQSQGAAQPAAPAPGAAKPSPKKAGATPQEAARAAAQAARDAQAAPKDEPLLAQARAVEKAARESRQAAAEAQRARTALDAAGRDREALAEIAKEAGEAAREAGLLADDAFQVKMEAVRREAEQEPPDVAQANRLAEKAAALAEKAAADPKTVAPGTLEALASELLREAGPLLGSDNPFLRQTAEMARKVADAAIKAALRAEEGGASLARDGDAPSQNPAGRDEDFAQPASQATLQKTALEAAESAKKAARQAARSPREQAFEAARAAEAAASAATNLAARLEAALATQPAEKAPSSETPISPDAFAREAAALAEQAEEVARDAKAAEDVARPQGAGFAANVAAKARETAGEARKAAEAAEAAAQALPAPAETAEAAPAAETPEAPPHRQPAPQAAVEKAAEAGRFAEAAIRHAGENAESAGKLAVSPVEHATRAAKAAKEAGQAAERLAQKAEACAAEGRQKNPPTPDAETLRQTLEKAAAEARREAQAAVDTAADTHENLPVEAANAARRAADLADDAGRAVEAARAQPQSAPVAKTPAGQAAEKAQKAAEAADQASRLARRAAATPGRQVADLERERRETVGKLAKIAKEIANASKAIKAAQPAAATNAVAAATAEGARRVLAKTAQDAAQIDGELQARAYEVAAIVANADRVAQAERQALARRGQEDHGATPARRAADDARDLQKALADARQAAAALGDAARLAPGNPEAALAAAERAEKAVAHLEAGKPEEAVPASRTPGREAKTPPKGLDKATGETQDLARQLEAAQELVGNARDALAAGDADQAREVAETAARAAEAVAEKAKASEEARKASAEKSRAAAEASAASAIQMAGEIFESARRKGLGDAANAENAEAAEPQGQGASAGARLATAASNVVAAASLAADAPAEAQRLASLAAREALALQAPSPEQREAARQANFAAQELRRMAAETAELAGLDPATMKVRKPDDYKSRPGAGKDPARPRKPAQTKVEGGGGKHDPEEGREEYEDGLALEMPEWLRRLGFPRAEWLKYKGTIESGLPDSALEHVAPEYRELVREYFRLLSAEKQP